MLKLAGWSFRVSVADIDETPLPGETPESYVCRLAEAKARAAARQAPHDAIILAADTAVVDRAFDESESAPGVSEILGKPEDAAAAEEMLRRLRGRTHQVYTALAVLRVEDGWLGRDLACTQVTMRAYSDSEMAVYIHSGDPLDKAGGYAIQHAGFRPVARIEGCYTNVVGLPLCRATDALARAGLVSAAPAPYACLYVPGAPCSVAYDLIENTPDMG